MGKLVQSRLASALETLKSIAEAASDATDEPRTILITIKQIASKELKENKSVRMPR